MTWDEVGDGCFRRRYRTFDLNIGVVRGSDALLVIDTRADLRQADELLDDLARFGRPVGWVVNSHWHFDHTFGNQRFFERARGELTRPSAVSVSTDLEIWGHVALPGALLASESDMRATLRDFYGDEAGDEYDRVVLTPPDRLVVDHLLLDIGDRAVELAHLGLGHTNNDLVVVVPDGDVVFAGDLLEQSGPPMYGDDSYPLSWPNTVQGLVDVGVSTFVPGHGDVMDRSDAIDQLAALTVVASLICELHQAGIDAEDALTEAGRRWPFPAEALGHAVQRGYEALG